MTSSVEFMFNGMQVGCFDAAALPSRPGRYRYMPYRSFGHYEMHKLLRAGGAPRCWYDIEEFRISFTVGAFPEYSLLDLHDFDRSPRP